MTYYDTIFCIHLCRLFANLGEFSFGNIAILKIPVNNHQQ